MLCQFHGVVQHPTDLDEAGFKAVDQEMPRSANGDHAGLNMSPTQSQVPGSNTCAKFGPSETARSLGRGCHIAECGDDQTRIAQSGRLTEPLMRPGEDVDDVALRGFRQPIAKHQSTGFARCAAR